jgi:chromosome segregation protein
MRLRRVKIVGFKTFADKTEIEIDGDLIAVVGPNGCGKSNIVDAILWGLGETSVRALRASSGKEVVFAGSLMRKPLGYAEVTVTFDNEDGSLPLDAAEVSVTRRVTRGGDGEYFINRRPCRLKDVADLLADSGLGRAGYAIVGQSEIDQALAASPQQRRAWIDEAAGVQRYRLRRQEAVRRLESTKQHLRRVEDVLYELEAQREPLREEAEVARRYRELATSLRAVEADLLIVEVANLHNESEALAKVVADAGRLAADEGTLATTWENQARDCERKAEGLEAQAEALRARLREAQRQTDAAESAARVAQAKLESLDVLQANLAEEGSAADERIALSEAEAADAARAIEVERTALETLEIELGGSAEEARLLEAELRAVDERLAQARREAAEAQRLALEAEHRRQRAEDLRESLAGIEQTWPDVVAAAAEAEAALTEATAERTGRASALAEREEALVVFDLARESDAAALRELLAERAAVEGQVRGVEATVEAHEGLAQGARAVLDLVRHGELPGVYRPVGELLRAKPELALAIDTALGSAANDLVVPDEAAAEQAIALLKGRRLGRATFQPLTLVRGQAPSAELRKFARDKKAGLLGLASEHVECGPELRPVVESLLGRVVVAEDLDAALDQARTSGWNRIVTLDGEVVFANGAVTGGRSSRSNAGLVQRQSELAELRAKADSLAAAIDARERAAESASQDRASIQAAIEGLRASLKEAVVAEDDARAWSASVTHELKSTERERARLTAELAGLGDDQTSATRTVDLEALEAERDGVWRRLAVRSADADAAETRLKEAAARVKEAEARAAAAAARVESLRKAETGRQARAEHIGPERERLSVELSRAQSERTAAEAERSRAEGELEAATAARRQAAEGASEARARADQARKSASEAENRRLEAELRRARLDAKRSVMLERLLDEYGVGLDEALRRAPGTDVPRDAQLLVGRLRRQIKEMGDVNVGAVEAYDRLTERLDDLGAQAEDVRSGMAEIESSVRELDRLTRERFETTFESVKAAFGATFRDLFGGGEGNLELSQADDGLDSGVDISVVVPGKKRQRLELLSGGERALSAIAFLFALLRVKPSPLVVLDEVDAPLDGRNVERFVGLLRAFVPQTQFILVTHNPTTISSADVWFGVTMQEPGVSTVVPFKAPPMTAAVVPDAYLKG